MTFSEQLNFFLEEAQCTQKDLAEATGFSKAMISRLCSGKREPSYKSEEFSELAHALYVLGQSHNIDLPPCEEIVSELREAVQDRLHVEYDVFLANLNYLLSYLGVKRKDLAKGIYSDISHVSKILSGKSRPGDPSVFIHDISTYLSLRFWNSNEQADIVNLLTGSATEISTPAEFKNAFIHYLGSKPYVERDESFSKFLAQLDEFNLNDYLKSVHFDDIKIPSPMPHFTTRKEYSGLAQMMESEIDFMKTTVLSKSMEDCIMYSDMPMTEMAADPVFPKKYMFGMAMLLKKGLHLNVIHDVNRPFPEMMLGLESWVPLYMTGQITPYYLPTSQNQVFLHFLKVSGSAALEGTAIAGNHAYGKYILYRSKEDVGQSRNRAMQLLKKASPLMDIYKEDRKERYHSIQKELFDGNDCKLVCSNLPLYLLPEELVVRILQSSEKNADIVEQILRYFKSVRSWFTSLLQKQKIQLIIPSLQDKISKKTTIDLSLSDLFIESPLSVSLETYKVCLAEIKKLEADYKNLTVEENPTPSFDNINISIVGDKAVVVSKERNPSIHFVIHHKRMIRAFKDYIPPLEDF